jgi:hypothetical protein
MRNLENVVFFLMKCRISIRTRNQLVIYAALVAKNGRVVAETFDFSSKAVTACVKQACDLAESVGAELYFR